MGGTSPGVGRSPRRRQFRPGTLGVLGLAIVLALTLLPSCAAVYREVNVAYVELRATFSPHDVSIELRRSFVRRLMDRVTMNVRFVVEQAEGNPNPPFLDGDLHFAGTSPQVQLPVVGEIINAASEPEAVNLVHRARETGKPVRVSGVWRIWPEHAGDSDERQGKDRSTPQSTNPDHVFEIHPLTTIAGISLLSSFHPVEGFSPNVPTTVVPALEKVHCRITTRHDTIVITTEKGLFNQLAVVMQITGVRQTVVKDGRFVTASLLDSDGRVLAWHRRMVFVRNTPPERAVRRLAQGDRLHVYGIPRIDLSEIWRRVEERRREPQLLHADLPYEIIVIGVVHD